MATIGEDYYDCRCSDCGKDYLRLCDAAERPRCGKRLGEEDGSDGYICPGKLTPWRRHDNGVLERNRAEIGL